MALYKQKSFSESFFPFFFFVLTWQTSPTLFNLKMLYFLKDSKCLIFWRMQQFRVTMCALTYKLKVYQVTTVAWLWARRNKIMLAQIAYQSFSFSTIFFKLFAQFLTWFFTTIREFFAKYSSIYPINIKINEKITKNNKKKT